MSIFGMVINEKVYHIYKGVLVCVAGERVDRCVWLGLLVAGSNDLSCLL